jgi:alpha-galactosidase
VVVTGAVAEDRSEAVFVVAVTGSPQTQAPTPVRLAGLDPSSRYLVEHVEPTTDRHPATLDPGWPAGGPVVTSGSLLMEAGLRFPSTAPESAYVLRLQDVDGREGHP